MSSSSPSPSPQSAASTSREESIRHLPAEARAAFERFQTDGGHAALGPVLFAILNDYVPSPPARPLSELPGNTLLIDDLGFDSLAITEVIFFAEDLFGIRITNEEIIQVRTLDDLRGFIHGKVTARTAP